MATHDVDQKLLGRLAKETGPYNALLSSSLFKILGISVRLTRRLLRARKLRKLDTSRETRSLDLYHRIVFLSREGLTITEQGVLVYTEEDRYHGPLMIELKIFAYKLRASFYHIFCLFHNDPLVSQLTPLQAPGISVANPGLATQSPNIQTNPTFAQDETPPFAPEAPDADKENAPGMHRPVGGRNTNLRDTIPSMVSEASYITNPYSINAITPPPGLSQIPMPQGSNFIMPSDNFVPMATLAFSQAASQAVEDLAGSNPLRLSVQLERCAFLWDCVHDFDGSRRLAAQAIRDCQQAEEGMDDSEFDDAVSIVGTLGLFMKRHSQESTPRFGGQTPRGVASPARDVITPLPSIAEGNVVAGQESQVSAPEPENKETVPITLDTTTVPQTVPAGSSRPSSAKTPPGSPGARRTGSRSGNGNRRSPRNSPSALAGSPTSPSRPRTRRSSNGNGSGTAATRAQRRNSNGNNGGNSGASAAAPSSPRSI